MSRFVEWIATTNAGQVAKEPIRRLFTKLGYELKPADTTERQFIAQLLDTHRVTHLLDVGANQGQYAIRMRSMGYAGPIHSFEPGHRAYELLSRRAVTDPLWHCHRIALGSKRGVLSLHVSRNSVSSSLLHPMPAHLEAAPASATSHTESVPVRRLDEISFDGDARALWLKVDTQGYELEVLKGAERILHSVAVLQAEVSFVELYEAQAPLVDLLSAIRDRGFCLVDMIPGFRSSTTGHLLQADIIAVGASFLRGVEIKAARSAAADGAG